MAKVIESDSMQLNAYRGSIPPTLSNESRIDTLALLSMVSSHYIGGISLAHEPRGRMDRIWVHLDRTGS